MQYDNADQRQVLTLLRELLSQRCEQTPQVPLQRYQYALRTFIYACPRQQAVYCKNCAYDVLLEAMHLIYHKKETEPTPWVHQVEEATYEAFQRLQGMG